ncbi:MAG: sugar transferase [Paludibacteraceae bacterium]|nr:sugar transferase [Paludibacteraceae bacterium]
MHRREKDISNLRIAHVVADLIAAILSWISFLMLRWYVYNGYIFDNGQIVFPIFSFYAPLCLYPLWCMIVNYLSGYYVQILTKHALRELFETFLSALIISITCFFIIVIDDPVNNYHQYFTSFYALLVIQFGYTYFFRLLLRFYKLRLFRKHRFAQPVVIVGRFDNPNVVKLVNDMKHRVFTYDFKGIVAPNGYLFEKSPEAYLGVIEKFGEIKEKHNICTAIVAIDEDVDSRENYRLINLLYPHDVDISMVPRAFELQTSNTHIDTLWSSPLVKVTEIKMSDAEWCAKRFFDLVMSLFGIIVLSPVLVICYICVKLDTPGPGFYLQERIGRKGKKFKIIKFRSMRIDAEESGTPQLSSPTDSRITRTGHYLRKYRIDELPQLFNVLKGDMSFVGPRPEREFFISQIMQKAPYYCLLYRIRPGITSWGPIRVGYTDTMEKMIERLHYDIIYMEDMSLRNDMKILFFTIEVIIKGKGQ